MEKREHSRELNSSLSRKLVMQSYNWNHSWTKKNKDCNEITSNFFPTRRHAIGARKKTRAISQVALVCYATAALLVQSKKQHRLEEVEGGGKEIHFFFFLLGEIQFTFECKLKKPGRHFYVGNFFFFNFSDAYYLNVMNRLPLFWCFDSGINFHLISIHRLKISLRDQSRAKDPLTRASQWPASTFVPMRRRPFWIHWIRWVKV